MEISVEDLLLMEEKAHIEARELADMLSGQGGEGGQEGLEGLVQPGGPDRLGKSRHLVQDTKFPPAGVYNKEVSRVYTLVESPELEKGEYGVLQNVQFYADTTDFSVAVTRRENRSTTPYTTFLDIALTNPNIGARKDESMTSYPYYFTMSDISWRDVFRLSVHHDGAGSMILRNIMYLYTLYRYPRNR